MSNNKVLAGYQPVLISDDVPVRNTQSSQSTQDTSSCRAKGRAFCTDEEYGG